MPPPRQQGKKPFRRHFNKKQGFKNFPRTSQGPKEYHYQNQLQETDVGITQFISSLEGFSGVIKARFSDFQVNEIDLNGDICKLTDMSIPRDFHKKEPPKVTEEVTESPIKQISQEKWDEIKNLLTLDRENTTVTLDAAELTKEDRGEVHKCLKQVFGKAISVNTKNDKDGKKVMEVLKSDPNSQDTDRRFKWPEDKGEYVHFILYKESLDTLDACLKISDCLKMAAGNFNYAGVKDKRAKTSQWVSVRKVEPWKLILKTKPLFSVRIGNITFKDAPLKLGLLTGNKFRIALRNVTGEDELIQKSLEGLKKDGYINYYGLQRFGNDKETPTFEIGKELLLGHWKEACQIILKSTKSDDPQLDVSKAKKVYQETEDASEALKAFGGNKNKCIEYLLLLGLSKGHKNDFVNALESIPRNMRLLYIHSFQSLIWNLVASKRIEKFGLKVVEGDLVILEELTEPPEVSDNNDNDESENGKKNPPRIKVLTADDCQNYSIYNVVLPLPGYDVIYPSNMTEFYRETLESFGLSLEMPKQKVVTYTLSGTYRKLVQQVQNLSWKIMRYDEPNYNLIRSDLEELKHLEEPKDVADGKYKALVLEFCLNSSSYATMVLREILKSDTSASSHAKLNNYATDVKVANEKDQAVTEVKSDVDDVDSFNEPIGLLGDAAKYEAFKNFVFNGEEGGSKRKLEDGDETTDQSPKIVKTD